MIFSRLHPNSAIQGEEGINLIKKRGSTFLILAITLENILEGLVIGIGVQSFPEGVAVSMQRACLIEKASYYEQFS